MQCAGDLSQTALGLECTCLALEFADAQFAASADLVALKSLLRKSNRAGSQVKVIRSFLGCRQVSNCQPISTAGRRKLVCMRTQAHEWSPHTVCFRRAFCVHSHCKLSSTAQNVPAQVSERVSPDHGVWSCCSMSICVAMGLFSMVGAHSSCAKSQPSLQNLNRLQVQAGQC